MFTFANMEAKLLLCLAVRSINLIAGLKSSTKFYILEYYSFHEVNKSITIEIVSSDIGYTEAKTGTPITDKYRQALIKKHSNTRFCFKSFVPYDTPLSFEKAYTSALESFLITQIPKLPIKQ